MMYNMNAQSFTSRAKLIIVKCRLMVLHIHVAHNVLSTLSLERKFLHMFLWGELGTVTGVLSLIEVSAVCKIL